MKKTLFCKGVFIGACIGGLVTLLHRETRDEFFLQATQMKSKSQYYIKHPTLIVQGCSDRLESTFMAVTRHLDLTVDLLNRFQDTLNDLEQSLIKDD